ncbi:hypothetical protein C8Q74DRAFT_654157 [Fomes fomentarius]|nr:hypothetical protein C8Q74DRAFT_654157 [Fomes fomentarius]
MARGPKARADRQQRVQCLCTHICIKEYGPNGNIILNVTDMLQQERLGVHEQGATDPYHSPIQGPRAQRGSREGEASTLPGRAGFFWHNLSWSGPNPPKSRSPSPEELLGHSEHSGELISDTQDLPQGAEDLGLEQDERVYIASSDASRLLGVDLVDHVPHAACHFSSALFALSLLGYMCSLTTSRFLSRSRLRTAVWGSKTTSTFTHSA